MRVLKSVVGYTLLSVLSLEEIIVSECIKSRSK